MLENKKDYDAGMKYVDQSLALKEDWYNLWIKAELLAAKGNVKDARATGEKAYELGRSPRTSSSRARSRRPSPSGRRRSSRRSRRGAARSTAPRR